MTEKLQKILSRAGIASRRALEQIIDQGRVTVNGKVATIGDRYEADDILVKVDGKVVLSPDNSAVSCRVLMYHKPEGELTTLSDPQNRPTVFDHIPKPPTGRWIYIGRLDINTSGLLLFTTDGELANALMHPKYEVERTYAARIYGEVTDEQLDKLKQGVMLEDGKARFNTITYVGGEGRNAWYHVTIKEGRKREVRRLWEAVGLKVSRLIRIKYAGVELDPQLKTGQFRELTLSEINRLRKTVKLEPIAELAPALDLNQEKSTRAKKTARPNINTNSSKSRFDKDSSKTNRNSKFGDKKFGEKKFSDNRGSSKRFSDNKNSSKPFSKSSRFGDKDDNRNSFSRDGFGKDRYAKKDGFGSKSNRPHGKNFGKSSDKSFGEKSRNFGGVVSYKSTRSDDSRPGRSYNVKSRGSKGHENFSMSSRRSRNFSK